MGKPTTATLSLVLAWLVLIANLSEAASAAQRPGARYDGSVPTDVRINLEVSADGSRLARYELGADMACNDGRRIGFFVGEGAGPSPLVAASGGFAFGGTAPATFRDRRNRRVSGTTSFSASGAFAASGESATGTMSATFTSPSLRCTSGTVPYTVHLDGTQGAPFRDGMLATGSYAMVGSRRLSFRGPLRTFAPAGEVSRLRFRARVRCRRGSFGAVEDFRRLRLIRGATVLRGRHRVRLGGGIVGRARFRLALRFSRGASYMVSGSWRISAVLNRRGRRIDTCLLRTRFSGRFQGGPANLY